MFILLLLISMIGYAVQGTLMVHHARKMDGISTAIYRSLSLGITMLPLLFFATKSEIFGLSRYWIEILIASGCGAIGSSISFYSYKFLPVGIKNLFGRVTSVIFAFILGWMVFGEIITAIELIFVGVILIASTFLSRQKIDFAHLDPNAKKGIWLTILSSLITGIAFVLVGKMSRELSPWVTGYFWETFIGFFALIIGLFRRKITGKKIQKISWEKFGKIALICWPTLLGTGGFLYAVKLGPYGIASAISAAGIFISVVLAHFWYHEKLSRQQLAWIVVTVLGIVGMELVRGM